MADTHKISCTQLKFRVGPGKQQYVLFIDTYCPVTVRTKEGNGCESDAPALPFFFWHKFTYITTVINRCRRQLRLVSNRMQCESIVFSISNPAPPRLSRHLAPPGGGGGFHLCPAISWTEGRQETAKAAFVFHFFLSRNCSKALL